MFHFFVNSKVNYETIETVLKIILFIKYLKKVSNSKLKNK